MSEPKFKPGDMVERKRATIKHPLEILAGPQGEHNVYWTLDEEGSYESWMEDILQPILRVVFSEAQFEVVEDIMKNTGFMTIDSREAVIKVLRRDHSQPEGEAQ